MELAFIRWIQSFSSPFLDVLFQIITVLGEELVLVPAAVAWFWLCDQDEGKNLGFTLLFSVGCNNILKGIFRFPRPIGQPGVRTLRPQTATGTSFPSGHSQSAATFGFFVARKRKGGWYLLATTLSLAVGLSRLYLGVHYPKDVVAGIAAGILCVYLTGFLLKRWNRNTVTAIISVIYLLAALILKQENLWRVVGLEVGFFAGNVFCEKFAKFTTPKTAVKGLVRLLAGIAALGVYWVLTDMLLPHQGVWQALQCGFLSFFAFGLYPYIFLKAGF